MHKSAKTLASAYSVYPAYPVAPEDGTGPAPPALWNARPIPLGYLR